MYEPIDLWTTLRAPTRICRGWTTSTRTGAAALRELGAEWEALDAAASRKPAGFGLVRQAAADLPASAIRVLTVRQRGALVAVWPLRKTTLGPLRVVGRLCRGLQVYDAPTIRAGVDPVGATCAAWQELRSWQDIDVVQLPLLDHDSPLLAVHEVAHAAKPTEGTCTIDLTGLRGTGDFVKRLGKKRRSSLRRRRRHLEALGDLVFEHVDDPAERREAVAWALKTKLAWLDARQAPSPTFRAPWFQRGLLGAAVDPLAGDTLRVFRLRVGARTIAVEIGHEDGAAWRSFVAAFDPTLADLGPGVALQLGVIGWCAARGLRTYDLLPPVTDFKQTWATATNPAHAATVPITRRGELLLPVVRDGRQGLKRAWERLPPGVRSAAWEVLQRREG